MVSADLSEEVTWEVEMPRSGHRGNSKGNSKDGGSEVGMSLAWVRNTTVAGAQGEAEKVRSETSGSPEGQAAGWSFLLRAVESHKAAL